MVAARHGVERMTGRCGTTAITAITDEAAPVRSAVDDAGCPLVGALR